MRRAVVVGVAACAGAVVLVAAVTGTTALALVDDGSAAASAPEQAVDVAQRSAARPVTGAVVSQEFGCTPYTFEPRDPSCASGHFHSGIDLAAPRGTPVRTPWPGIAHVVVTPGGFGLHVVVVHAGGLSTLYGHLSSAALVDGSSVTANEVIGAVGSTGNSTGPHLHFEVRRDGVPENPRLDVQLP